MDQSSRDAIAVPEDAEEDQVELLFPIPLLRSPKLLRTELCAEVVAELAGAQVETNLRSSQLVHTMVTDPHRHPLFRALAEAAVPKLVEFGFLLFGERLSWTVKEMWLNRLAPGGSQTMHAHANSFISGVYYLTPSHPASNTVFVRPPGGSDYSFRHHTRETATGPFNAGKYMLPRAEPATSSCFRAISITRCRAIRVRSG